MTIRAAYRLLVESEKDHENPCHLVIDPRGWDEDLEIDLTIINPTSGPYEDVTLGLNREEAHELVATIKEMLDGEERGG
jgi:hypothetical protein